MSIRACLFFFALTCSIELSAAIFQADDRVKVAPQEGDPLAVIGRVTGPAHSGTGFLVSECLVLTVQHIVDDDPVGRQLRFRVKLQNGESRTSWATVLAAGNFDENRESVTWATGRSKDWMLLRLHKCLGRTLGFAELDPGNDLTAAGIEERVRSAGFPIDRRSRGVLIMDPSCRLRNASTFEWFHDCATLQGNSGSPIFRIVEVHGRKRLRVVGLTTSGGHGRAVVNYDLGNANRATRMSYLTVMLRPYISHPAPSSQSPLSAHSGN